MQVSSGVLREKYTKHHDHRTLDEKIRDILFNLGIKAKNKGFEYLHSSIKLAIEEPESAQLITKDLYIRLAKKFSVTPWAFERNMRTAINSMPISIYRDMVFYGNMGHYSNKEFILHIARYLSSFDQ